VQQTEAGNQQSVVQALIDEGLAHARSISHPVMRPRHLACWAFRVSRVDAERATALTEELTADDPEIAAELLLTVTGDRLHRGEPDLEPHFSRTAQLAREAAPDLRLRILNELSEYAIELGNHDPERARDLLRGLAPEARELTIPGADPQQPRALACALVGEALLNLGDPTGTDLLEEAERLSKSLPARDPLVVFLADAWAGTQPERARRLLATAEDPASRLQARLQLASKTADAAAREALLTEAEADVPLVQQDRGPEALVRIAQAVAEADSARARPYFEAALAAAAEGEPQVRVLHWTGVAAAVAGLDREWSGTLFQEAVAGARQEPDRLKRVTLLCVIANEMAASHPRDAEAVFTEAMEDGLQLEAMWEFAHVMDVVFHPQRSPYLDLAPARMLLEQVLSRITDEDPRIPGVLGLPEVSQWMVQIDRDRAFEVLNRWLTAAERSGDGDGMTTAALALYGADPERGTAALNKVRPSHVTPA
jgi:hypothetical protein